MELKQVYFEPFFHLLWLLIVPYGIETCLKAIQEPAQTVLLIVPYGIETQENQSVIDCCDAF